MAAQHGVNVVIALGMGTHARDLFVASSTQLLIGVSVIDPEVLVTDFMNTGLETGANYRDHSGHACSH